MIRKNAICSRIMIMIIAMMVGFVMVNSTSFAASIESPEVDDPTTIQWEYQIIDENGIIEETGYIPNPMLMYNWTGVTIQSGKTAVFKPSGKIGLYAVKGTSIKTTWRLNKQAKHKVTVTGNTKSYSSGNGYQVTKTAASGSKNFTAKYSDNFYGKITNLSSSSITVKSFSITF